MLRSSLPLVGPDEVQDHLLPVNSPFSEEDGVTCLLYTPLDEYGVSSFSSFIHNIHTDDNKVRNFARKATEMFLSVQHNCLGLQFSKNNPVKWDCS